MLLQGSYFPQLPVCSISMQTADPFSASLCPLQGRADNTMTEAEHSGQYFDAVACIYSFRLLRLRSGRTHFIKSPGCKINYTFLWSLKIKAAFLCSLLWQPWSHLWTSILSEVLCKSDSWHVLYCKALFTPIGRKTLSDPSLINFWSFDASISQMLCGMEAVRTQEGRHCV